MTIHQFCIVLLAVLPLAAGAAASTPARQAADRPLIIRGVRVIDGTGGPAQDGMTVVVTGERITRVGKQQEVEIPAGAEVIDGAGKTLLPGLIDTHVHFRDYVPELFIAHGVTTVRDGGNPPEWILALKRQQAAGTMRGPRIFAVGNILDAPPPRRGHHIGVATPEAARAAARALLAKGVDGIKVYEKITPELLRPIVEEAHAAKRKVIGHITFSAREAVLAGIDALEHASGIAIAVATDPALVQKIDHHEGVFGWRYMDAAKADSLIELLVQRRVAVVPALAAWARGSALRADFAAEARRVMSNPELAYLPQEATNRAKSYAPVPALADEYAGLKRFLTRFKEAGGRVVMGTDGGALWGLSLHHELQLLVDMGFTPSEAIKTATANAAELLQQEDIGTVAAGKIADLLIVDGNPMQAIADTKKIGTVIQRGRVIDTRYHRDYRIPIRRPAIRGSGQPD